MALPEGAQKVVQILERMHHAGRSGLFAVVAQPGSAGLADDCILFEVELVESEAQYQYSATLVYGDFDWKMFHLGRC